LRVAVISDIHSNLEALCIVLEHVKDADLILNLGDLVGYGADPNAVIDTVRNLGDKVISIMGNHDYAALSGEVAGFNPYAAEAALWTGRVLSDENKAFLAKLPLIKQLEAGGFKFLLVHGSPRDPLNEYIFPGTPMALLRDFLVKSKVRFLLMGHTHVPMRVDIKDPVGVIMNPGSVGQSRDYIPRASFVLIEFKDGEAAIKFQRVDYDIDLAAAKIVKAGLPPMLAYRLYEGW